MTTRPARQLLGWVLVTAGAALNAQTLVDWMRHGTA